jgi:hypothetical protein
MTVTDGPFTEAKELVGGFAILRTNSKQQAIELAKQFLAVAGYGECELRQWYEVGDLTCGHGAAGASARLRATLQERNEGDVMGSRDGYRHTSRD